MEEFEFSENAYFFKLREGVDMGRIIRDLFHSIEKNSEGDVYMSRMREPIPEIEGMCFSFKAFKRVVPPPCFKKDNPPERKFLERKFAYLLVIEYHGYVVVVKRYIPTIRVLRSEVTAIDYTTLCNLLVSNNTVFKKFSMNNLDMADYAMRSKIVEAEDLKSVFSTVGANNYALNSMRIVEGGNDYSLAMNLSKVNQYGKKVDFNTLASWFKIIIEKIENCSQNNVDGYLSIFATPVDYSKEYEAGNLKATAVLVSIYKIHNEDWIDKITKTVETEGGVVEEIIDVNSLSDLFQFAFDLKKGEGGRYYALFDEDKGVIDLQVGEKGISFASEWCREVVLHANYGIDHSDQTLEEYIKEEGLFTVMFDKPQLKYASRQLFCDNRLTGNIEVFLKLFEADEKLTTIKSEKGQVKRNFTVFPRNTLFNYIEKKYHTDKDNEILVCDDLGTEWADHILIRKDSVALYAAKHKRLGFSASAFQEVVGQAQKNLGVFYPLDTQWDAKERKWREKYRLNHIQTNIDRVRTAGKSAKEAVDLWKKAEKSLNFKRDVYLVIDFISHNALVKHMTDLKEGRDFAEKKEAIPMLWLISSLYATCQEMHIGLHITCQP